MTGTNQTGRRKINCRHERVLKKCSKFSSRIDKYIPCSYQLNSYCMERRSVGMNEDIKRSQEDIQKTDGIHTGVSAQQSKYASLRMNTNHVSLLTVHHLCWLVDTSDDSRASYIILYIIYVSRLCCTLHTSWLDRDSCLTSPLFFSSFDRLTRRKQTNSQ